jgi:hypothetical protein
MKRLVVSPSRCLPLSSSPSPFSTNRRSVILIRFDKEL